MEKYRGILYGQDGASFPHEGDSDAFAASHDHEVAPLPNFQALENHFLRLQNKSFGEALHRMVQMFGKEMVDAWLEQRSR